MRVWLLPARSREAAVTLSQLRTPSSTPDVGHAPHDTVTPTAQLVPWQLRL